MGEDRGLAFRVPTVDAPQFPLQFGEATGDVLGFESLTSWVSAGTPSPREACRPSKRGSLGFARPPS